MAVTDRAGSVSARLRSITVSVPGRSPASVPGTLPAQLPGPALPGDPSPTGCGSWVSVATSLVAYSHRPSGVTATPNGLPPVFTDAVPAGPSSAPAAVAPEHPGDASARAGSAAAGTEPAGVVPAAGGEDDPLPPPPAGVATAAVVEALPDVQPAPAPSVTATRQQAAARPLAKPRFMPSSVGHLSRSRAPGSAA